MSCLILTEATAIRQFAEQWGNLTPPSPFSGWGLVARWLRQAPSDAEPFVLAVLGPHGELLALAPWQLSKQANGMRQLSAIGAEDAWYHDLWVLRPEHATDVATQVVDALRRTRRDWDLLSLNLRPEMSAPLIQALKRIGWSFEERIDWRQQPLIAWTQDWQTYWNERPSELREVTLRQRRMVSRVPHRYYTARGKEALELLDPLCRHQASNYAGAREWDAFHAYMRMVAEEAMATGTGFLHVLEIDGQFAAAQLQSRHGDRVYGLLRSYDVAFKRYSPGSLLAAWSFEELHREGARWVDMGPGHYAWKHSVQTGVTETVQMHVSSPGSLSAMGWVGLTGYLQPALKNNQLIRRLRDGLYALTHRRLAAAQS